MNKTQEALKLALEALEYISSHYMSLPKIGCMALAAVEEALAEQPAQQQEPVAWGVDWGRAGDQSCVSIIKRLPDGGIEVLATEYGPPASKPLSNLTEDNIPAIPPAQRTWVGLTDDEIALICAECSLRTPCDIYYARAIEAKLREKNA